MSVVIETTLGVFTVDLYTATRPKLCKNFLKLCKVKFYNFCLFHNVQPGFLAQSGAQDPEGRSGESIYKRLYGEQAAYFEGEMLPKIKHDHKGSLSMVAVSENMFGSQFFVTLDDNLDYLNQDHCVFGEITEGHEILEKFNEVISDDNHRPYQDIRITHTVILDDPFEDPPGLEIPRRSPSPNAELLKTDRLAADADLDQDDGLTEEQLAEKRAEKEAKAQAQILEMIGDLPDADCAPPENVLFVCKLNPVTTDDDLEIIFSRFGKVVSCEVIRDRKTNDSLQYAFVEFDNEKSCETAYFKMDNVLIDDRRIHVDFSQSVSKYKWKGKGRLEVRDESKKGGKPPRREAQFRRQQRSRSRDRTRKRSRSPEVKRNPSSEKKSRRRSPSSESGQKAQKRQPPSKSRSRSPKRRSRSPKRRSRSRERLRRSRSRSRDRRRRQKSRSRSKSKERRRRRPKSRSRSRDRKRKSRSSSRDRGHSSKKKKKNRSRSRSREDYRRRHNR